MLRENKISLDCDFDSDLMRGNLCLSVSFIKIYVQKIKPENHLYMSTITFIHHVKLKKCKIK